MYDFNLTLICLDFRCHEKFVILLRNEDSIVGQINVIINCNRSYES